MHSVYDSIISTENLLDSWREFVRDKKKQRDVVEFGVHIGDHIMNLRRDLVTHSYQHGGYRETKINDPKSRTIHIASVRDRLLHHAIYRALYSYFDETFIFDSYSCRCKKGTHRALNRFREYALDASHNHTRTVWVLKCDIRKFFANIDHAILQKVLSKFISDENTSRLLKEIIGSFNSGTEGKGLPLGNLTSQLLVNIYMNEFDQFMKHTLKVKYYIRYADDFVILSQNKMELERLLPLVQSFLFERLRLSLHPNKVFIKTLASGLDFLGWVHFPDHRVLRTSTKRRMLKRVSEVNLSSYLGLCIHGDTYKLRKKILTKEPLWLQWLLYDNNNFHRKRGEE